MQYRNPVYTADGRINCEINHSHYGWIPFTADANDIENHGKELFDAILKDGGVKDYEKPDNLSEIVKAERNAYMEKIELTDQQIDHIAEKAAEVAFKKIYEEVGRSVVKKIFWIVGAGALGLLFWMAGNGQLPK